ncbi:ATP-binding protein [Kocuria rosea]|uniref:ATP-binding protein n=1 Tax=Kocuria rosea TaxID=1275 RepID=UPI00068D6AB7|nr:ATP-binding protein [Kocuria polaris]
MAQRTRVFLGSFTNERFTEALRTRLRDTGEFDVVPVGKSGTLSTDAGDEPSVLLAEGHNPSLCRPYLDRSVSRTVLLVDPAATSAFGALNDHRWAKLVDVVRTLAEKVCAGELLDAPDRVRVLDTGFLTPAADPKGGADSADLEPLLRWLDVALALPLARRGDDGRSGVVGWSVAPHEAFEMLGLDSSGSSEKDLENRLTAAEDDLFGPGQALPPTMGDIKTGFSLSGLDLRLFCLLLAPEIDGRYATAIGVLQDDLTRRRPGLTLLAELMSGTGVTTWDLRRYLHEPDSLVAKGLVRAEADGLAVDAPLVPSAAVVAYLLSKSPEQAAAAIGAELWTPTAAPQPSLSPQEECVVRQLQLADSGAGPVRLVGGDRSKRWFGRVAGGMGVTVLAGNLQDLEPGGDRSAAVNDWSVLCRLLDSALLLLGTDTMTTTESRRIADLVQLPGSGGRLVAADGDLMDHRGTSGAVVVAPTLSAAQRSAWWTAAARQAGLVLGEGDPDRLAATVSLDPGDFASAVRMAVHLTAAGVDGTLVELVQRSARDLARCDLPAGVRRIEPVYGWSDIVVGDENRALLESISQHVLYEGRVMEEWGFSERVTYGRGVSALFSGPSGTGKTMAAQIIAKDLGVDLLQVDLSKTVSKYIGDTEKNLDMVFEAAECNGSVLLFDEADAIFGRRTEIKDAHDRHANVEVAYLLQRLEEFRGLTILTTNMKRNIDDAFARRLRFVIDFALPTAEERVMIWHQAFPEGVLADGHSDIATVASRLPIAGGSIQNIALHAAFLAAPGGGPIGVEHVFAAIRRELLKMGMRSAVSGLEDLMPNRVGADRHDQRVAS